jgi:hypothetical protein
LCLKHIRRGVARITHWKADSKEANAFRATLRNAWTVSLQELQKDAKTSTGSKRRPTSADPPKPASLPQQQSAGTGAAAPLRVWRGSRAADDHEAASDEAKDDTISPSPETGAKVSSEEEREGSEERARIRRRNRSPKEERLAPNQAGQSGAKEVVAVAVGPALASAIPAADNRPRRPALSTLTNSASAPIHAWPAKRSSRAMPLSVEPMVKVSPVNDAKLDLQHGLFAPAMLPAPEAPVDTRQKIVDDGHEERTRHADNDMQSVFLPSLQRSPTKRRRTAPKASYAITPPAALKKHPPHLRLGGMKIKVLRAKRLRPRKQLVPMRSPEGDPDCLAYFAAVAAADLSLRGAVNSP